MTEKEMKKLSRGDLLELLLRERKENEELRGEIERLQEQLEERILKMEKAGSIAEAALQLNGVFEAAQNAAYQYLENIRALGDRHKQACEKMRADTEARCREIEMRMKARYEQSMERGEETPYIHHGSDNDAT